MALTGSKWRLDRPAEGFDADPQQAALPKVSAPVAVFPRHCQYHLPDHYVANYPYPLLIVFHGHGGNEHQGLQFITRLSRRNFAGISLRGTQLLTPREDGQLSLGWGDAAQHDELITITVRQAFEAMQKTCNIHTERVFLVGLGDGANAAYRVAARLGESLGGLVVLNGALPTTTTTLLSPRMVRGLPTFLAHGQEANRIVADAKLLRSLGAEVTLKQYSSEAIIHEALLTDVNSWLVEQAQQLEGRFSVLK